MCLAIPVRVQRIVGEMAEVELSGVVREVSLVLTPQAREGDYVLIHTGFAISVIDEQEAQETLALFAELEEAERRLDAEEGRVERSAP
jgi:hydrogenase expression/formation protein HypC